ncbi:MAG TPA: 16S rRNA (guanine(966)-N(2))-methyltransferase RsmD [Desulfobacterales bacterium]|nr:16S rRNA (guanine(966)-N(2))-methyltransferase RsmD [Desulfobacterales bacterium]
MLRITNIGIPQWKLGVFVRIIGGALRGKKLYSIKGLAIRPTTDYVRESVFNILANGVEDAVVLDLFAGAGTLGIEALSRGAETAVFVDKAPQAIKVLTRNICACCLEGRSTILRRDILHGLRFLKSIDRAFGLVFIDPPYDKGFVERTMQLLDRAESTSDRVSIIVEHNRHEALPEKVARYVLCDQRDYGKTLVSFYGAVL